MSALLIAGFTGVITAGWAADLVLRRNGTLAPWIGGASAAVVDKGETLPLGVLEIEGEATIAEQGSAADTARRVAAADHPLVRAIIDAFPGARIDTVHDTSVDDYGLPAAEVPEVETSDEMELDE